MADWDNWDEQRLLYHKLQGVANAENERLQEMEEMRGIIARYTKDQVN